jgi:cysteine desulfurase
MAAPRRVYLDHNATTPLLPEVVEAVARTSREVFGNPSSVHWFGQQAKIVLDEARQAVAHLLGAAPSELVFTAGGTESDNLAIRGAAAAAPEGRRHLVTTAIEHEAVLRTVRALEREGWRTTLVRPPASGIVDPDEVAAAFAPDTALVSVMLANNETGALQPVTAIAERAHARGLVVHVDAVQGVGKVPVAVSALGADLLSLSGHKINGPKGVGALWVRPGTKLLAQMTGGRQERSRRAGTENLASIAGLGVAAAAAARDLGSHAVGVGRLRDRLERAILAGVPDSVVNGDASRRVPNTTNVSFDGVEAESLLMALDVAGFAVSTGSACSSGTLEPSHVLRAMGLPPQRVQSAIRFSLGPTNTEAEVDDLAAALPPLVARLRRLAHAGSRR